MVYESQISFCQFLTVWSQTLTPIFAHLFSNSFVAFIYFHLQNQNI